MSTVVSRRRGNAAQVAATAGAVGEILADMTNMRLTLNNGTTLGGFPQAAVSDIVGRNRIINGNFAINQRGYASGGTLGASAYAHDRWKDTGGGTWKYTFSQGVPDTLITITAGAGGQVIEAANIEGGNYMLSWLGTAPMAVFFTNTAGTATSVGGATSPLAVIGVAPGTQLVVASNGNGTLGLVQFEAGTVATKFERRHIGQELALCQRYYQLASYLYGFVQAANQIGLNWTPIVPMRAIPTVTLLTTTPYIESPPFSAAYSGSGSAITAAHNSSGYTQAGAGFDLAVNGFSGLTSGATAGCKAGQLAFSAEL